MKRLIAVVGVIVLGVTLFSPAATASQWDPKNPPVSPYEAQPSPFPDGDADPWDIERMANTEGPRGGNPLRIENIGVRILCIVLDALHDSGNHTNIEHEAESDSHVAAD